MTMHDSADLWWSLPGPRQFIDRIASELRQGVNVALEIPCVCPASPFRRIRDALRDFGLELIRVEVDGDGLSPIEMVRRYCDLPPNVVTGSDLARAETFSGLCFYVTGVSAAAWQRWSEFLVAYSGGIRGRPESERSVFCLEVPLPTGRPPAEDITLRAVSFHRVLRRLDMLLFASLLGCSEEERRAPLLQHLHAQVVTELAVFDGGLATHLARISLRDLFGVEAALAEYGTTRGLRPGTSLDWRAGSSAELDGAIVRHVCAEPSLREAIAQALWRAEIAVLFPALESLRVRLIGRYRGHLQIPWRTTFGVLNDVWELELGDLFAQLSRRPVPSSEAKKIRLLRDARNALAHLEVVRYEDVRSIAEARFA